MKPVFSVALERAGQPANRISMVPSFSADGKRVVAVDSQRGLLEFSLSGEAPPRRPVPDNTPVTGVPICSATGEYIVVPSQSGFALFHGQAKAGTIYGEMPAFSPNGSRLAFVRNGHLVVRELKTGSERDRQLPSTAWSLALNDDGNCIVSSPGNFGPWTGGRTFVTNGDGFTLLDHRNVPLLQVGWWHGQPFAAGYGGDVCVFDRETGRQLVLLAGHSSEVKAVVPTNRVMYSLDADGVLLAHRWIAAGKS
ncbi:WD40 repeat domain-containing protein [Fimbriimonas ginsengisoli]|nr:PD40 domain-containing protein [Fimbriimonas ginsengisoli]